MEHIGKVLGDYPRFTGLQRKSLEIVNQGLLEDCEKEEGYTSNPNCPVCKGSGFVHPRMSNGKADYAQVISCHAKDCVVDQRRIYQTTKPYLKKKGVNRFKSFDNFKPVLGVETTLAAFKDIAFNTDAPPLLFVYGITGNGKTYLCEATVTELLKRGIDCRLWVVADLVSKLKESISENTTELLVSSLKKLPALILDEWGQNYGSIWEEQKLEEIVVARERSELITIITSNLEPDQLGKMPERVISRFRDKAQARMILNKAVDFRPSKRIVR